MGIVNQATIDIDRKAVCPTFSLQSIVSATGESEDRRQHLVDTQRDHFFGSEKSGPPELKSELEDTE